MIHSFVSPAWARAMSRCEAMNGAVVELHPHARERADERGATESEVIATVERGERFPAKSAERGSEGISLSMACGVVNDMVQSKSKPLLSKKADVGWLSLFW
jgi:hypothetical protein